MCLGAAGVDGEDGTVDNAQEGMHGARAAAVDGMVPADTHSEAVSRKHVGSIGHGSGSTCSRHPFPVAVRGERDLCLSARQHC